MIQFPILKIKTHHSVFIQYHDVRTVCSSGPTEGAIMESPLQLTEMKTENWRRKLVKSEEET